LEEAGGFVASQDPSGRFAVFVAIAILAAGCTSSPPRSAAQARADEATANRIYAALNNEPVYYFRDVDVGVDDGVARLSGYVWTTAALYRAQRIARSVPGVTAVKDELQLERAAQRGGGDGGGAQ
jgi:osmotically-inducible protein OsmY